MCLLASRRSLRMATLVSSASFFTCVESCRRRSALGAGTLMRIWAPSTMGFRPRPAFSMAFTTSCLDEGSKGFTMSCVASATLIAASSRRSVLLP